MPSTRIPHSHQYLVKEGGDIEDEDNDDDKNDDLDEKELEKKVNSLKHKIDTLIKGEQPDALKALVRKLRVGRSTSLQKYGEYGFENLVFKELRNAGYIDKVRSTVVNFKTKSLSL